MSNLFFTNAAPQSVPSVSTIDTTGQPYTHRVEMELLVGTPRQARLTPNTMLTRRWIWNLMIGTFLVLAFFGRRDIESWDALLRSGRAMQAAVTNKYTTTSKGHTYYHLNYAFTAEEKYCSDDMSVSEADYNRAQNGDSVTVTYLPGSKGETWQEGIVTPERRSGRLYVWIAWTIGMTGLVGISLAICNANWKHQLRILQTGTAVVGQVTEGKINQGSKGEKYYYLIYNYPVGARPVENKVLVSQKIYEKYTQGNPFLTVLYDSENPEKSLPYFQITSAHLNSVAL